METIDDRPFDPKLHATPRKQCGKTGCGEPPTISRLRRNAAGKYSTRALCEEHATELTKPSLNEDWLQYWGLNGSTDAKEKEA